MQVVQKFYEGILIGGEIFGLIIYMWIDGVQIVGEVILVVWFVIGQDFGDKYVLEKLCVYFFKVKNVQEVYEVIWLIDLLCCFKEVVWFLDLDQVWFYELIWKCIMVFQMEFVILECIIIEILVDGFGKCVNLWVIGLVVCFDGFFVFYQEGRDDEDDENFWCLLVVDQGVVLIVVFVDGKVDLIDVFQYFIILLLWYIEVSLVKKMEEFGIGCFFIYVLIFQILCDWEYVEFDKKQLVLQDKGCIVMVFLESFFGWYIEFDFIVSFEEQFDKILVGELFWLDVLKDFWMVFFGFVDEIKDF